MRLPFALVLAGLAGCASAAAPSFELHGDDFDRVRGEYQLADGHVARLVGTRRHPWVQFDDGRGQPLRALSATEFVGVDGCLRVRFEAHANGTVTRMRVVACGAE